MDILSAYGEDNDNSQEHLVSAPAIIHKPLCSAPSVALVPKSHPQIAKALDSQLMTNPKAEVVLAPLHGPAHPFKFNAPTPGAKLAGMGHIEDAVVEDFAFNEQYQTYQRSGYAVDVSTNEVLGDYNEYVLNQGDTAQNARGIFYSPKRIRHILTLLSRCLHIIFPNNTQSANSYFDVPVMIIASSSDFNYLNDFHDIPSFRCITNTFFNQC